MLKILLYTVVVTMCVRFLNEFSPLSTRFDVVSNNGERYGNGGGTGGRSTAIIRYDATDLSSKPALYNCATNGGNGYWEMKTLMASVLPEYELRPLAKRRGSIPPPNHTNEYDVFIHTVHGGSDFRRQCGGPVGDWLFDGYEGKFLWFTGESQKFHPADVVEREDDGRDHYFGVATDESRRDSKDFLLTYMQMVWFQKFSSEVLRPAVLVDPSLRPRGNITTSTSTGRPPNFMIYANGNCVGFREAAVGSISEIGPVHCDGKCGGQTPPSGSRENLTKTNHGIGIGNWWENVELYSNYRFCFVMEHEEDHPYYVTEKIIMAFAGGCVPVYHGPELIFDIFDRDAFVFYNISSPQESLDKIRALENDEALYEKMMERPIVADGNNTLQRYFSFGDESFGNSGTKTCKQRMREKLGVS